MLSFPSAPRPRHGTDLHGLDGLSGGGAGPLWRHSRQRLVGAAGGNPARALRLQRAGQGGAQAALEAGVGAVRRPVGQGEILPASPGPRCSGPCPPGGASGGAALARRSCSSPVRGAGQCLAAAAGAEALPRQILLVAAALSFGISYAEEAAGDDWRAKFVEPGVIVLILVLNATVGVIMVRSLPPSAPFHPPAPRPAAATASPAARRPRKTTRRARWTRSRSCRASTPRRCGTGRWRAAQPGAAAACGPHARGAAGVGAAGARLGAGRHRGAAGGGQGTTAAVTSAPSPAPHSRPACRSPPTCGWCV